jgi:4-amino-4-deoxy-L-arabinose transferase-like glycosyltransferase
MAAKSLTPWLAGIVAAYLALAVIYSVQTPLFEASDEYRHLPLVAELARNGLQLPVQSAAQPGPWAQEGSQPPLYYLLTGAALSWIDWSNFEHVWRLNPHVDSGFVRSDGNLNLTVHRPFDERFPWGRAVLGAHLARLISVALGMGTVIVTFLLAGRLFPDRPEVVVGATALNAFLPMFLFISGSVNNDNLSNLVGNALCLALVAMLGTTSKPGLRTYGLIGVLTGIGLLSKLNLGFMIPLVALSLVITSVRFRSWTPLMVGGLVSGSLTIAIAGWWYVRNVQLYSDVTGLTMFLDIVGRRDIPADFGQLWTERFSLSRAFWGMFGGMNLPMPGWIYTVFDTVAIAGAIGAAAFFIKTAVRRKWETPRWLLFIVPLSWTVITVLAYLRWTSETPASQGRLLFGALSAICIWLVLGITWWLPGRLRPLISGLAVAFALGVSAIVPFTVIAPAYAPPPAVSESLPAQAVFSDRDGRSIALFAHEPFIVQARPGDEVTFALPWQVTRSLDRNWSQFTHAVDMNGVIVAQRDMYPGRGLLATSDLPRDRSWQTPTTLRLPDTLYTPAELTVLTGWYDVNTGERLTLGDGRTSVVIGTISVAESVDEQGIPNPIHVNFGNVMSLEGYTLSETAARPGDSITLTLHWRRLSEMDRNYTVFAHIVNPATTYIAAGSDAQPAGGARPTSSLVPDERVTDVHTLTVRDDAPPGMYELEVGVYHAEGDFPRLPVINDVGGTSSNYVYLTRIRVLEPSP